MVRDTFFGINIMLGLIVGDGTAKVDNYHTREIISQKSNKAWLW